MEFTPDYTETKGKLEAPLSGTYAVRITSSEPKSIKMKDGQEVRGISWRLVIFGSKNAEENGKNIFYQTSLSGPFAWTTRAFLESANPKYNGGAFDTADYLGKTLEVTIKGRDMGLKFAKVIGVAQHFEEGSLSDAFPSDEKVPF